MSTSQWMITCGNHLHGLISRHACCRACRVELREHHVTSGCHRPNAAIAPMQVPNSSRALNVALPNSTNQMLKSWSSRSGRIASYWRVPRRYMGDFPPEAWWLSPIECLRRWGEDRVKPVTARFTREVALRSCFPTLTTSDWSAWYA